MEAVHVLHQIALSREHWGGVQIQFTRFLEATRDDHRIKNHLTMHADPDPERLAGIEPHLAAPPFNYRRWRGVRIPSRLQLTATAARARKWRIDVVLNMNLMDNARPLNTARRLKAAAAYWERGSAWFPRRVRETGDRSGYALVIVNSRASGRMLRDVWNMADPTETLPPCVWDQSLARLAEGRTLASGRPLRLGFAGRLRGFKGGVLAVHTVAELQRRGVEAELLVAGDGPDRQNMAAAAERLNVAGRIKWLGTVGDMSAFYAGIDLLLHPALREPYGNICAEAALAGVPAVASLVDGLPEVVEHGATGLCVTPELGMEDFGRLGGNAGDVYPAVFRPDLDRVSEPAAPSPTALADAVIAIAGDTGAYVAMSRRAAASARTRFAPSVHIDRFIELMTLAAGRR